MDLTINISTVSRLYWVHQKTLQKQILNLTSSFAKEKQKEEQEKQKLDKKIKLNKDYINDRIKLDLETIQNLKNNLNIKDHIKLKKIKILELKLEENIKNDYYNKSKYYNISELWFIKPENIWSKLCIDELSINWEVYTILSNPENSINNTNKKWIKNNTKYDKNKNLNTNKNNTIIAFIKWIKSKEIIKKIWDKIDYKTRVEMVKEVASDLSPTMKKIIRELFPSASLVLDRFHVMKILLDDLQSIRIRLKTKFKDLENQRKDECKISWVKFHDTVFNMSNIDSQFYDESILRFITALRRQLYKRRSDWNDNQKARFKFIENISPDYIYYDDLIQLKQWYEIIEQVYSIYDKFWDTWITPKEAKEEFRNLINWKISKYWKNITEIRNMWNTLNNNLYWICNYFISWHSNWFAEWLHSRIRRNLSNARWFKNKDYMVYKIEKKFS